jgi:hypothetical protein
MYQSWTDLDHAVEGLNSDDATTRTRGGSSIAWTVGHATQMVDSWLNVAFQNRLPHPVVGHDMFRTGASGDAQDWPGILVAIEDVRLSARRFLDSDPRPALDRRVAYEGSIKWLRPLGLELSYAILRIAAHHFWHAGEILEMRSQLGHTTDDDRDWGRDFV